MRGSVSSYVSCPVENSKHIRVNIGLDDLAVIQATIVLLKSKSATYLRIGPGTFVDSAGISTVFLHELSLTV